MSHNRDSLWEWAPAVREGELTAMCNCGKAVFTSPLVGEVDTKQSAVAGEGYLPAGIMSSMGILILLKNTPHPPIR